ncbi:antioxidant and copper/iron homeostasis protein [Coniochaeta ligniaria NRRL 30616]|uniref:Antioxidant and copper/iron homeostasis protein n=1 Tax=Coniochaeta ligniaria NRRL 30616 TaxID=1408157 RepID=A0A1J7IV55_9PEZI|nr:antioxidant and copper/iron homeostasis protein [Coniochaeta ligniaria NRRL 30616]
MTQSYEYDVQMSCGGCASAVRTAVTSLRDVHSVETSVEKQKVNVTVADDVTFDQVKLVIENAGKHVKGGRVIAGEGVTEMPVQAAAVN